MRDSGVYCVRCARAWAQMGNYSDGAGKSRLELGMVNVIRLRNAAEGSTIFKGCTNLCQQEQRALLCKVRETHTKYIKPKVSAAIARQLGLQ